MGPMENLNNCAAGMGLQLASSPIGLTLHAVGQLAMLQHLLEAGDGDMPGDVLLEVQPWPGSARPWHAEQVVYGLIVHLHMH